VEAVLGNDQYIVQWECGEQEVLSSAEIEELAATNPNVNRPATRAAPAAASADTTTTATATTTSSTTTNPAVRAEPRLPHRKDLRDATIWEVCTGQIPGVAVNERLKSFLLTALEEHKAREIKKTPVACMEPEATRCAAWVCTFRISEIVATRKRGVHSRVVGGRL
jgi:pyruvate/2-oxoglutarate dehydrogenase complex dihydrolipoamide acyltransferase (E2) component